MIAWLPYRLPSLSPNMLPPPDLPPATTQRLQQKCDSALEELQRAVHDVVQLQADLLQSRPSALDCVQQQQAVQKAISQAVSQLQLNNL